MQEYYLLYMTLDVTLKVTINFNYAGVYQQKWRQGKTKNALLRKLIAYIYIAKPKC